VEFVLSELQRSCFDAQELAQAKLQEWLKGVVSNLSQNSRELNLDWLTKLNIKEASSELALLQRNTLLEKENHQLKKELLE